MKDQTMENLQLVCLNGRFIPHEDAAIAINDGGYLFGETLFETFKAHKKTIMLEQQHLDRIEKSAVRLDFPFQRQIIEKSLQQLATGLTSDTSRIRLTLSRGTFTGLRWPEQEEASFLITAREYPEISDRKRTQGISCVTAPNRRVNPFSHLPQMKHGNYADCLYAYNFAHKSGADEALFIDQLERVLEVSSANIFALIDDRLITPPADHLVLDGIMRQQVIHTAAELGIPFSEKRVTYPELLQAEEVFITNSLIDILPVSRIDEHSIQRGTTWKSLLKTLWMRIEI